MKAAEDAPEYGRIGPAEGLPIDNDVEMNDLGCNSDEDNEVFGSNTVPPVKTPGKNLRKVNGGRKKTGASNLRAQIKLNRRQITPSGSTFQNSLVRFHQNVLKITDKRIDRCIDYCYKSG